MRFIYKKALYLSFVLTVFLAFTTNVSAENSKSEIYENESAHIEWNYNAKTNTLSLKGEGWLYDVANEPWEKYIDTTKHIVISKEIDGDFLYLVGNDKIQSITVDCGNCKLFYDDKSETVTINGNGTFIVDAHISVKNDIFRHLTENLSYNIIIGNGITEIKDDGGFLSTDNLTVGTSLKYITGIHTHNAVEVSASNPYLAIYKNCLYSKDYKKLFLACKNFSSDMFHPNLSVLGKDCLYLCNINETSLKIPWGVTTLENNTFRLFENSNTKEIIFPDTLKDIEEITRLDKESTIIYSENNLDIQLILSTEKSDTSKNYGVHANPYKGYKKIRNMKKYYDIRPNSLKTFQNGKTYYFDSNYKMAKGWTKVKNTWYYFNDYGAAVVKIWLKSGNKWYYMQEDGTMATNKWIKWYNKWYYVGKDGAMYANRKTPDGYYVNASGVWVK